ncbi:hypothetical protein RB195_013292 [Necator americanus]|uniref:Uncharacterized protein n=1 Tax=Necator americanus TaxID=51031 RepID=A0ABR1DUT5_NECAM
MVDLRCFQEILQLCCQVCTRPTHQRPKEAEKNYFDEGLEGGTGGIELCHMTRLIQKRKGFNDEQPRQRRHDVADWWMRLMADTVSYPESSILPLIQDFFLHLLL